MSDISFKEQFSDNQRKVKFLRQSRLFSPFPEELLLKLSPLLQLSHFPESCEITREGELQAEIFFLVRGRVSAYAGGEFILTLKRLGDICGEMCLFEGKPLLATDIAETDVDMLGLKIEDLCNNPEIFGNELKDLIRGLCSAILVDKLAITTQIAGHFEKNRRQMQQAISESRLADRAQSNFLANISHEVRTPMHGVVGMCDLLLNGDLKPEQAKYARIIQQSAANLQRVIDDIVNIADLERGDLYISSVPFSLHQLMSRLEVETRSIAENKSLRYSMHTDPQIPGLLKGDPVRIHQVLLNLIGNAIKFTHQGSIDINVALKQQTDEAVRVQFSVKDTGIGIEKDHFESIFKPFAQVDTSTASPYSGLGLGLSISRQLVELMGGQIGFDTTIEMGSTFWVELDISRQPDRRKEGGASSDGHRESDRMFLLDSVSSTPSRVLVVDHDRVNRLVAVKGLQSAGCHVESIDSGEKAIRLLELLPFDLVLINIYLPENSGLKTTRKIRSRNSTVLNPAVPILGMTTHVAECSKNKVKFAGLSGLIQKPLTRQSLQIAVSNWLADR